MLPAITSMTSFKLRATKSQMNGPISTWRLKRTPEILRALNSRQSARSAGVA
jgi:hypothetical protein